MNGNWSYQSWLNLLARPKKGEMSEFDFTLVVIIGAPRSGTNILRDVLTTIDGITTWPCDEINYIWRHGNARHPSDELPANLARTGVAQYIRHSFATLARRDKATVVVEKTCANSLRVPFVDRIIPGAKYIYIRRDGIDVAASARLRWTAGLDIPFLWRKVRYVPILDLPYYALKYLRSRIYKVFSAERRLASWGPRLEDMNIVLAKYRLIEVCAIQWQRCVEAAERAFAEMPRERVLELRYEDFVERPAEEVSRLLEFIGHDASSAAVQEAVHPVHAGSLGKGRKSLPPAEIRRLELLVGDTLRRDRHH